MTRKKHQPLRTCVGCRQVQEKHGLIRLVRTASGVVVDETGKLAGRGAYLHDQKSCWEAGLAGPLARALRTEIDQQSKDRLQNYMETKL